ncbi:MAG: hypothetical protein ACRDN9_10015 [Streptosporangiaceae bacterium]
MLVLTSAERVERRLSRLTACFNEELARTEIAILENAHDARHPDHARPTYWDLWLAIADAHDAAAVAVRRARDEVWRLVDDAYEVCPAADGPCRVGPTLADVWAELDRAFSVSAEGGTLARLVAALDACLDTGGRLAEQVARRMEPALAVALAALGDLFLVAAFRASVEGPSATPAAC